MKINTNSTKLASPTVTLQASQIMTRLSVMPKILSSFLCAFLGFSQSVVWTTTCLSLMSGLAGRIGRTFSPWECDVTRFENDPHFCFNKVIFSWSGLILIVSCWYVFLSNHSDVSFPIISCCPCNSSFQTILLTFIFICRPILGPFWVSRSLTGVDKNSNKAAAGARDHIVTVATKKTGKSELIDASNY